MSLSTDYFSSSSHLNDFWSHVRNKLIDQGMFGRNGEEKVWSSENGIDCSLSRSLHCEAILWLNASNASFKKKKLLNSKAYKCPHFLFMSYE